MMIDQEARKHLRESLAKGIRYDGRKKDEFRNIEIITGFIGQLRVALM